MKVSIVSLVFVLAALAHAADPSYVKVGDPHNAADIRFARQIGSVSYEYQIGMFEVTASQYADFLNATVREYDPNGLYNPKMALGFGCRIIQSGGPGNWSYKVTPGNENLPVNYVSWMDAARYVNWLANGQPNTGRQDASSTEDGSYDLLGISPLSVVRKRDVRFVLPSEDEWYKAAYYKSGSIDAGYWLYPTQSDELPSSEISSAGTNNANHSTPDRGPTKVGTFGSSPGPYGTFDQGGNIYEWNEMTFESQYRGLRGGCFDDRNMNAEFGGYNYPGYESSVAGFRVVIVPEPSLFLVSLTGVTLLMCKRSRV